MQVVVSTLHQVMCCQSLDGFYTINTRGDQRMVKKCYNLALKVKKLTVAEPVISDK